MAHLLQIRWLFIVAQLSAVSLYLLFWPHFSIPLILIVFQPSSDTFCAVCLLALFFWASAPSRWRPADGALSPRLRYSGAAQEAALSAGRLHIYSTKKTEAGFNAAIITTHTHHLCVIGIRNQLCVYYVVGPRFQLSQYTSVFATHILPAVQFCNRKQDRDTRPSRAACTSVSCL